MRVGVSVTSYFYSTESARIEPFHEICDVTKESDSSACPFRLFRARRRQTPDTSLHMLLLCTSKRADGDRLELTKVAEKLRRPTQNHIEKR